MCAVPASADALFDKAVKVVRQTLPKDPGILSDKRRLSCHYYQSFMVKEVDMGEVGADQLSILPIAAGEKRPDCKRDNAPNEKVVDPKDWSGYFRGAKGGYVFFDAADGWNGGMGFVVYAPSGKKVFEDAVKIWKSVDAKGGNLTLKYTRVFAAKCSLRADAKGCWRQIKTDTGLGGNAPDCNAAYERERKRTPQFAQQIIGVPTVVDYEVETVIATDASMIKPVSGKALGCRPTS